jgi:hypothetical protein
MIPNRSEMMSELPPTVASHAFSSLCHLPWPISSPVTRTPPTCNVTLRADVLVLSSSNRDRIDIK